ncbi:GMC family oxidoreductase [Halomicroarcula sp. GCM10025324]|uniref:GMC family oxidoreductase n=1 Tax=Haloarcula TaxID=2237 RepID=UPI0023E861F4|nr:GMC family oxidoreductase [Halomicroarcula sp. ZS-22-S1]
MSERQRGGDRAPAEKQDVCVIGSGVAGALVAYALSDRGHDVVMLEAGKRFDPANRLQRMERAIRPEYHLPEVWDMGGERDRFTSSGDLYYALNRTRVKAVGGTTLHWLGITPRFHEKDFEMQSRYGLASDWPIGYEDLRPYYAEAETELGVSGGTDNPFAPPRETDFPMDAFPASYSDSLFAEACEALGITMHSVPQARNSEPYDDRSQCVGYSTCIPVCPSGAKYSGDVHVRKAQSNGARVISQAPVQYLEHDSAGERVEAAVYATPDGERHRQEARQFVLACGAVEIPRLLLLSRSSQYPEGLANTSGVVGKYFMDHLVVRVGAELDEPTNQEPIGYQTRETHQFYDHDDSPPGSVKLVFENVNPPSLAESALRGGDTGTPGDLSDVVAGDTWGDELVDTVRDRMPNRRVGMFGNPETLPRAENSVTLDYEKTDSHGNPVPDVSFTIGGYERRTIEFIRDVQRDILNEMDASNIVDSPLRTASHKMGTTRMGTDPSESVVDSRLRTHDLRNLSIASSSVFVTGGAMNPTLTIAALSLKAADAIHRDL